MASGDKKLGDVIRALAETPPRQRTLLELAMLGKETPPPKPIQGSLGGLFGTTPPPSRTMSFLGGLGLENAPRSQTADYLSGPGVLFPTTAVPRAVSQTKRRAFFSFHYDDVMRVNNVRKSGEFKTTDNPNGRSVEGFYDGSLWESRKLDGPESIKSLIRDGVQNTSAVCVLAGTETWARRWVRYEIARAIIDGRGLLTVHINGLKHHRLGVPHVRGINPLHFMAVGKVVSPGYAPSQYYLFEFRDGGWYKYEDYTHPVTLPRWLPEPRDGHVSILSSRAREYDYVSEQGHHHIGRWIDEAALQAGR